MDSGTLSSMFEFKDNQVIAVHAPRVSGNATSSLLWRDMCASFDRFPIDSATLHILHECTSNCLRLRISYIQIGISSNLWFWLISTHSMFCNPERSVVILLSQGFILNIKFFNPLIPATQAGTSFIKLLSITKTSKLVKSAPEAGSDRSEFEANTNFLKPQFREPRDSGISSSPRSDKFLHAGSTHYYFSFKFITLSLCFSLYIQLVVVHRCTKSDIIIN